MIVERHRHFFSFVSVGIATGCINTPADHSTSSMAVASPCGPNPLLCQAPSSSDYGVSDIHLARLLYPGSKAQHPTYALATQFLSCASASFHMPGRDAGSLAV